MYNKDIKTVLSLLNTSSSGLNSSEVKKRLNKYGLNKLIEQKKTSVFVRFFSQFKDPMIIILLIVALLLFIYAITYSHEFTDIIVILAVVLINAIVGFIEEEKAESVLSALKKYESHKCKVKRDGKIVISNTFNLVPGDIILLEAGDTVPCDIRLLKADNVVIDESALTGESVGVIKEISTLSSDKLLVQDQKNMCFMGTSVTSGTIVGVVTSTGMDTELGNIASSIEKSIESRTPLELKIEELSKKITIIILILILFIFLLSVLKGYTYLETIMLCASIAVAAIPEGLPAVIAITLSGGVEALARKKTVVKHMHAVETLGATDVICSDKTGTITLNKMKVKEKDIYNEDIFNYICALCNEGLIYPSKYVGDPTETCLYEYLKDNKIDALKLRKKHKRIASIPFTSERKISSTINDIDGNIYMLSKGSVEKLLDKCSYINNKKITKADINKIKKLEESYASNGLRVLGFAYKKINKLPKSFETLEKNLKFIGLIGIVDPARDSVKNSVLECKNAGITPIMITGDSINTAYAIAKEVGIADSYEACLLGEELDKYSDKKLISLVKKYSVYARVKPLHKERIVNALKASGKVVAMTGDGVNDAPAIKNAHVGVGMGITGTDVTKEAADIILVDDSFSTIVDAVEEGRRIYTNIRNNVVYCLSSNFAEILIVLVGLLTNNIILLPIHILFIDLVTDSIPSIALAFEKSEKGIMNKKPRGIKKNLFTPFIKSNIVSSFLIESVYVLVTYFIAINYVDKTTSMTIALLSLVIQEIVYAISCRNLKNSFIKQGIFSNKVMTFSIILVLLIELLVFLTPVGSILHIERMSLSLFGVIFLFNITSLIIYESLKPILRRYFKD